MIEVAADQQQDFCRRVGYLRLVTGDGAGEHVVDHYRRNRRDQTQCCRQQGFGNAGSHDGEVGGLGLGDADEAVHDAPYGTEQADEWRSGTDGGEYAGAAAHVAAAGCYQALKTESDAFLDAFFFAGAGRQMHFFQSIMHQQIGQGAWFGCRSAGFFKRGGFFQVDDFGAQTTLGAHQLKAFGNPDGPGDDRSDGQADHHDFHDDVGVLVHAPRRQVMGHAQGVVGFEDFRNVFTQGFCRRCLGRIGRGGSDGRGGVISRCRGCGGRSCWRLGIGESRDWREHQAEEQGGHRAPGARSFGWRSGELIACHAGRT
ncbi:hypothetical protein D3C72_967210 [compost metagenome]